MNQNPTQPTCAAAITMALTLAVVSASHAADAPLPSAGTSAASSSSDAAPAGTPAPGTLVSPPVEAKAAAPAAPARPAFRLFRYEEDYSFLADPAKRTEPLDELKYIKLGESVTLSLGGETRTRYEYSTRPAFGVRGLGHDDYLLQRFVLHGDLHVGDRESLHARAFVQLVSGLVWGEERPKAANQDNALDVQQGFIDLVWGDSRAPAVNKGGSAVTVRTGRQEMGLGSFRLVTSREPTNSRLNFDGVRTTINVDRIAIDAFLLRPVELKDGVFNDGQDDATTFWGLYAAFPLLPEKRLGLDAYYLGLDRERTRFQTGIGDEERHSLGLRLHGRSDGWDHDTEGVLQLGSFDATTGPAAGREQDILAWTIASNTGYTFANAAWTPRLGLKLNYASGDDDPGDDRLATFNPLFPRNNYFSDANLLAPYNFFDIHPHATFKPVEQLTMAVGLDAFFRANTNDAVFSPAGITIPAQASDESYVGSTLNVTGDYAFSRFVTLTVSYAHFFRGDVVRDAGGKDVDFLGVWLTAKF
ncbi:MAG: alginate export family protein [Planctomycetota bacterium]|nr:alginate export family protein [Planctomycetota bacterium]